MVGRGAAVSRAGLRPDPSPAGADRDEGRHRVSLRHRRHSLRARAGEGCGEGPGRPRRRRRLHAPAVSDRGPDRRASSRDLPCPARGRGASLSGDGLARAGLRMRGPQARRARGRARLSPKTRVMSRVAPYLVIASAAIMLLLGTIHVLYTYRRPKLRPRDPELEALMARSPPVISSETTMWRCWIGFNASPSLGLLLFGLVYGCLAAALPAALFGSRFLQWLGLAVLSGYLFLARRYWFRAPFRLILAAWVLFAAAIATAAP